MTYPWSHRAASLAVVLSAFAAPVMAADFDGIWKVTQPVEALRTSDGARPPLRPDAAKVYEQHLADRRAGKLGFDPDEACKAPGAPRIMTMRGPFQILQTPKQIFMLFQWNRELRMVDLNVTHDAQNMYAPTWFGFSVGAVRGYTLSIDTTSYNDATLLDESGLPHSDQLHTVERYTLAGGGRRINAVVTIDDSKTYTRPWTFKVGFTRLPSDTPLQEDVCVERQHLLDRKAENPI